MRGVDDDDADADDALENLELLSPEELKAFVAQFQNEMNSQLVEYEARVEQFQV